MFARMAGQEPRRPQLVRIAEVLRFLQASDTSHALALGCLSSPSCRVAHCRPTPPTGQGRGSLDARCTGLMMHPKQIVLRQRRTAHLDRPKSMRARSDGLPVLFAIAQSAISVVSSSPPMVNSPRSAANGARDRMQNSRRTCVKPQGYAITWSAAILNSKKRWRTSSASKGGRDSERATCQADAVAIISYDGKNPALQAIGFDGADLPRNPAFMRPSP